MASFRKRGPCQWQAQVRRKGQPLQSKTFETRAEPKQWVRAIEVEMDKGVFVSRAEAESTTLQELLERFLEEVTPLKIRGSSRLGHRLPPAKPRRHLSRGTLLLELPAPLESFPRAMT